MLSTLNPKHTDLRDDTEPRDDHGPRADEVRLVARVEEELSKLAHESASHAAPSVPAPAPRGEADASSERPAPPVDVTPRPAIDAAGLSSLKPVDPRNDPHDFVPIIPAVDEPAPAQHVVFNPPPPRVARARAQPGEPQS